MKAVVDDVAHHLKDLKLTYTKLQQKIVVPFQTMKDISKQLTELNAQGDNLRAMERFLQVFGRLESISNDVEEYPRAASYSFELCILR